jgi:cephalosporin-C deacetylase
MIIGKSLPELESYKPALTKASDFSDFWQKSLTMFPKSEPVLTPIESPIRTLDIFDVTIAGFNGDPIKGWFLTPKGLNEKRPLITIFEGYGGGRGEATEWLFWPSAGYPTLVMDTRGQGGGHRRGETPDGAYPRPNQSPGFMTAGIEDPNEYYYRRVFIDAVSFTVAGKYLPNVDATKIITTGGSQGGGISLAAASLNPEVYAVMADVPFLCHFERAIEMTDDYPYQEIANYFRIQRGAIKNSLKTLSYFDCMNLVTMAKAKALISVGLHDPICPADTIFAMRNHYQGEVDTTIWQFNRHEGGGAENQLAQAKWLAGKL